MSAEITYVKDTFASYLGKKDHISSSDIKNFMKSPRYYYFKKYLEKKDETSRHLVIGSALHESILEPHKFLNTYIVAPNFNRRTNEGKKEYADFQNDNKDKVMLLEDEMDLVRNICESALLCEPLMELIKDSYKELSIYTTDEITGLKLKLRPDIYCKTRSTIVDLKSCQDSSPRGFKRDVFNFGYSISASYYSQFAKKENYLFCALEKNEPYQVAMYGLSDEMLEYGAKQVRIGLDLLKWCYANKYFPTHNEFSILLNCYELGSLDDFFEISRNSDKITILQ